MTKKKKNLGLDEIISIEDVGIVDTYDFTIPNTHCFFANNILVHNTLEEHSDTVLLLHWQNFYDHNPVKENIFKIYVAKQRNGRTGEYILYYKPEYYRFYDKDETKKEAETNPIMEKIKEEFNAGIRIVKEND